mmetsp:Transcript_27265/g.54959  ORF Transcript_27265/g.54959 Transcript_27265/m.54959 type:complete len:211 (+) Transcript_27265:136-768(+)
MPCRQVVTFPTPPQLLPPPVEVEVAWTTASAHLALVASVLLVSWVDQPASTLVGQENHSLSMLMTLTTPAWAVPVPMYGLGWMLQALWSPATVAFLVLLPDVSPRPHSLVSSPRPSGAHCKDPTAAARLLLTPRRVYVPLSGPFLRHPSSGCVLLSGSCSPRPWRSMRMVRQLMSYHTYRPDTIWPKLTPEYARNCHLPIHVRAVENSPW